MKDARSLLIEADPLRREPELSDIEADRLPNAIVSAARHQHPPRVFWPGAFALAAVLVITVIAAMFGGRFLPAHRPNPRVDAMNAPVLDNERRQVQFATPGGTRIIWTLDPEFPLREVMP